MIDNPIEFKINTKPPKMLLKIPQEGDMNYLFLSISQARYVYDQLYQSLKAVNYHNDNAEEETDIKDIVVTFPKETGNDSDGSCYMF